MHRLLRCELIHLALPRLPWDIGHSGPGYKLCPRETWTWTTLRRMPRKRPSVRPIWFGQSCGSLDGNFVSPRRRLFYLFSFIFIFFSFQRSSFFELFTSPSHCPLCGFADPHLFSHHYANVKTLTGFGRLRYCRSLSVCSCPPLRQLNSTPTCDM